MNWLISLRDKFKVFSGKDSNLESDWLTQIISTKIKCRLRYRHWWIQWTYKISNFNIWNLVNNTFSKSSHHCRKQICRLSQHFLLLTQKLWTGYRYSGYCELEFSILQSTWEICAIHLNLFPHSSSHSLFFLLYNKDWSSTTCLLSWTTWPIHITQLAVPWLLFVSSYQHKQAKLAPKITWYEVFNDRHWQCCRAGLFCWSRWKSSGSGLLLCGLGVLWWQSSDSSYKI